MTENNTRYHRDKLREESIEDASDLQQQEYKKFFENENYEIYFIEYIGDIESTLSKMNYAKVYITDKFFGILFVQNGMLGNLLESVPEIINIQPNVLYSLSELVKSSNINSNAMIYEHNIPFNGEGVIVGIIGTGIDYLNPRFQNQVGNSRIISIWDQTIKGGPSPQLFPYGREYSNEEITNAIKTSTIGKLPYEIVAHRDEVGHGTAIAGIIGGRNLGNNDKFKSIAPRCEFAIVKLQEARKSVLQSLGINEDTKNVYQNIEIASAIRYLSDLQTKLKKPIVVYLPLGTNFGGRDGSTIVERYIDNLSNRNNFSVVTNTGNQGIGRTHTSGRIKNSGAVEDILINIDSSQSSLILDIYMKRPDVILISITSPNGDIVRNISIPSIKEKIKYLVIDENNINIQYLAQETLYGSIAVNLVIKKPIGGVWKVSLTGQSIISGLYDSWLMQSELLRESTRFLNPVRNTTLLTPCSAMNIISTSYYNEVDNTIASESGRGFPRNGKVEPVVAISGINLVTIGLNNEFIVATGGAMAGAILAGAVTLIYQWGVVQGHFTQLYPPRPKNLIISATRKDNDKIYPNEEWGFGKLSFDSLYEVLLRTGSERKAYKTWTNNKQINCMYVNIPSDIYERLFLSY